MRFAHPVALVAALLLPWMLWVALRKPGTIARRVVAWRAVTALFAILAAAGLAVRVGDAPATIVIALDRSASISSRQQQQALDRVNALRSTMRAGDRLGLVSFGADAGIEWRPRDTTQPATFRAAISESGTDIGAALRLARAILPPDGARRILLMSDGRDNSGHAERDALRALASGIPVDVIPPATSAPSLRVTRVSAPPTAAVREPYLLSVEISGAPRARGTILVHRDDQLIGTFGVTVGSDGTHSLALTERQDVGRSYVYRATTVSDDGDPVGASSGTVVLVEGQPAVLYVSDAPPSLGSVLGSAGFRVSAISPEKLPETKAAFEAFAGVVLDDVPVDRLTPAAIDALTEYVDRSGGGLLILGSARSLTLSGYPTTALSPILPIDLRPRAGQRAVPVELILLVDKSGSMADTVGGLSKIEVARQAVMQTVSVMPTGDGIGVVAFDSAPDTIAPLTVQRDEAALRAALAKVRPGGSTTIAPALEAALQLFRAPGRPDIARRHILLISDGRTTDSDSARLLSLSRARVAELSAVAIGANANRALLEELARASGGRAYFPENLSELPRMVAREAVRSSGGGAVEEPFVARAVRHPILETIDVEALPRLHGYVVSSLKPSASAILTSHLDDPILCAWRAGLGRVAVFTGDLGSRWSSRLRTSPEGGRMWIQAIRWMSRRERADGVRLQIVDGSGGPRLEMESEESDASAPRFDKVRGTLRQADGAVTDLDFELSGPGRYAAPLPLTRTGPFVVAVTASNRGNQGESRTVRTLYWSADIETRGQGADLQFLTRLASMTGGRVLGLNESPFDAPRPPGYFDPSMWLAAAALVMFLLDIAFAGTIAATPASFSFAASRD